MAPFAAWLRCRNLRQQSVLLCKLLQVSAVNVAFRVRLHNLLREGAQGVALSLHVTREVKELPDLHSSNARNDFGICFWRVCFHVFIGSRSALAFIFIFRLFFYHGGTYRKGTLNLRPHPENADLHSKSRDAFFQLKTDLPSNPCNTESVRAPDGAEALGYTEGIGHPL